MPPQGAGDRTGSGSRSDASRDSQSIGAYLAHQRRLRGISTEELAQLTRIPVRSLERLEAGSFDHDVDGFVRGFVRTVSLALGLDADDTLARMLREPGASDARLAGARPGLRLALVVVLAMALLGGLVGLMRSLLPERTSVATQTERVVRRDPVRALAEAQGMGALERTEPEPEGGKPGVEMDPAPADAGEVSAAPPVARAPTP